MNRSMLQLLVLFAVLLAASGTILVYGLRHSGDDDSIYLNSFRLRPGYTVMAHPQRRASRNVAARPDNDEVKELINGALSDIEANRIDEAEDKVRTVLVFEPDHQMALTILGRILYSSDHYAEAEVIFRRQFRLAPDNPTVLNNLGSVLVRLNRLPEAINYLDRAWEKAPDSPEIVINLAGVYAMSGNNGEALKVLRRAEKILGPALLPLASDASFDSLRDTVEFRRLLRRAAERQAGENAAGKAKP